MTRVGMENHNFDPETAFGIHPEIIRQISTTKEGLARRMTAYQSFLQIAMPNSKDRAWRRTPIDELTAEKYHYHLKSSAETDHAFGNVKNDTEFLVTYRDGCVENQSNDELRNRGVLICSLQEAEEKHPSLLASISGKIVLPQEDKFSALTQLLDTDGLLVHIPKELTVELPIHLNIFHDPASELGVFHLMISLEENATATVLHEWDGSGKDARRLLTGVVEIRTAKNANLEFVELQTWPDSQWSILHERAEVGANSQVNWSVYAEGGKYSRSFLGVNLAGERACSNITGICLNTCPAQQDFDTFQHHQAQGTGSDLLFNGAMANDSRSIWKGMIRVEKQGMKTDGYQANRNLILCGKPRLESIPGLEILADDVRCSHGVSVGEIDLEQLFYLTSRGIPEGEAKQLIAQGFLNSGLGRIANGAIRREVESRIQTRLAELFCK